MVLSDVFRLVLSNPDSNFSSPVVSDISFFNMRFKIHEILKYIPYLNFLIDDVEVLKH